MKIADAWINLKTNIAGYKRNVKSAEDRFKIFTKNIEKGIDKLEKRSNALNNLFSKMRLGLAALAAGAGFSAKSFVDAAGEMERYALQFKVLYGSAEAARLKLAEVSRFAAKTPFELPGVIQAAKLLKVFKIDSAETLKVVGDAAAAAGRPLQEVAMWLGRLAAGDTGEALMRLREMGLITRETLEAQGMEFDRGGRFKGSVIKLTKVVIDHLKNQYGGMMNEMSTGWEGMMSNLSDAWFQIRARIGERILPYLKEQLGSLLEAVDRWVEEGKIDEWADRIAKNVTAFLNFTIRAVRFIAAHTDEIKAVAAGFAAYVVAIKAGMIILKFIKAVKVAGGVMAALNAVMAANPIGLVAVAIGALVAGITYLVNKMGGWGNVVDYVWAKLQQFWQFVKAFASSVGEYFKTLGKIIWHVFTGQADKIKDDIKHLLSEVGKSMVEAIEKSEEIDAEYNRKRQENAKKTEEELKESEKAITDNLQLETDNRLAMADGYSRDQLEIQKKAAEKVQEIDLGEFNYKRKLAADEHQLRLDAGVSQVDSQKILADELKTIKVDETDFNINKIKELLEFDKGAQLDRLQTARQALHANTESYRHYTSEITRLEKELSEEKKRLAQEEARRNIDQILENSELDRREKEERLESLRDMHEQGSKAWKQYNNAIKNVQVNILEKFKKDVFKIGSAIDNFFSDTIATMINEGKSFRDASKQVWESMRDQFIRMVTQMITKWLTFLALKAIGTSLGIPVGAIPMQEGYIAHGPTNAIMGEGGEAEAVLPLHKIVDAIKGGTPLESSIPGMAGSISPIFERSGESKQVNVNVSWHTSFDGAVITDDDNTVDQFYENTFRPAEERFKKRIQESI